MKSLIKYFIRYPINGNLLVILIFIFGWFGFNSLKTTFFPNVENRSVTIQVVYPGASPEEIEEGVVLKIENNLKGLSGVEQVTSISNENFASITVDVLKNYDRNKILQDVKNAVDRIGSFPIGMEAPVIFNTEAREFAVSFAVSGDTGLLTLKNAAQRIENDLLAIDGISKISIDGYPEEEIEISFTEENLRNYQLTFEQVRQAVRASNLNMTGGTVKGEYEELLVRAKSKEYYAQDLENIILKTTADGRTVRLKDVAQIKDQWADSPKRTYLDGKRTVIITVSNTNQEDLITVSTRVKEYIDKFNQEDSPVKLAVVRDGAKILKQRISLLEKNGIYGAIMVLVFIAMFLNPRLGFWVALGLPISFMGMFILGGISGLTINMMSLFGMILVVGILVDDGIIIGESIYQKHEQGMPPEQAALAGTMHVLPAVFTAVMTTVLAFSVFFFLDGRMGEFMSDMAFVVIATLLFSLIEGAFILPAHIAHSKSMKPSAKKSRFELVINGFMMFMREKWYSPVLKHAISHKAITFSIAVGLLVLTFGAIKGGFIQTTYFPYIDRDNISVSIEMGSGTPDEITEARLDQIVAAARSVNEDFKEKRDDHRDVVLNIQKRVGPKSHEGNVRITLLEGEERNLESFHITNAIREKTGYLEGTENVTFGSAGHFGKAVSLSLQSHDFETLKLAKADLKQELSDLPSLKNITDSNLEGLKEINITLKEKSYLLGISLQDVISGIRQGFFGSEVQRLQRGLDEVRIWVRYEESERSSVGKLENMWIKLNDGREFPLKDIANFEVERGVLGINHIDGKRQILVTADMTNPKESVTDMLAGIRSDILPAIRENYSNVTIGFEGQRKDSAKTGRSAKTVVPIILILMFAIIVVTFRSFSQTITVFAMIPLGFIGVAGGHFIHGMPISIMSMFGIIALIGIMVNDSLVLVTEMNYLLKDGMKFRDAVFKAGITRFRPIVLTSVTTVAGLGPLILETSRQAQFLIPMAVSVAYGIIVATTITLIVLPVSLVLLNDIKYYLPNWIFKKKLTREDVEPAVRESRYEIEF
ncbi:MAG: efflux RND transporter permease subunit [Candidatus Marinimicrobia bacterium]|nr:efflux RND transporter permease subunit [Candidatus Neomarinimicrobiota bacterium]